jgi:16S rRNA (guanine966-N2)-methyltransferase
MTRIIGGEAGGRRLKTPPGPTTRPTADRVREALFSSLESLLGTLSGRRFLDLYAGSGAVGLEARSRGADHVTLVESSTQVARLIESNARGLGLDEVDVLTADVGRVVSHEPAGASYDVVFLDPPYDVATATITAQLDALVAHNWLTSPAAVVVVERPRREAAPWPASIVDLRSKRYGETMLWYGHPARPDDMPR